MRIRQTQPAAPLQRNLHIVSHRKPTPIYQRKSLYQQNYSITIKINQPLKRHVMIIHAIFRKIFLFFDLFFWLNCKTADFPAYRADKNAY